jgi:hypothetical protein
MRDPATGSTFWLTLDPGQRERGFRKDRVKEKATSAVVAVVLEAETLTVAGVFPTSRFQVPDHRWEDVIRSRRLLPRDLRVSAEGERMISHQDLPTGWTQGLTTAPDLTVTVPPPLTAIVPSPLTAIVPSRQTDFRDAI